MGSITERRVQSAHTPRSLHVLSLFLDPLPFPPPPAITHHPLLMVRSFPRTYIHICTRSQSCLFLFLRCLSVCSTLMHLLAYRYNCRAIIKAGLSFSLCLSLCLSLLPPSPYPRSKLLFLSYPSLPSLFFSVSYPCCSLGRSWTPIANAFRSRSTCVPVAFSSRSPTPCTDFEGKSRRVNFCASGLRISGCSMLDARCPRRGFELRIGDEPCLLRVVIHGCGEMGVG